MVCVSDAYESHPASKDAEHPTEKTGHSDAYLRAREWRSRLKTRLKDEEEWDLLNKLSRCGQEMWFRCTSCSHRHRGEQACHLKWCPVCARARSAQRVSKYRKASMLMQWPLH